MNMRAKISEEFNWNSYFSFTAWKIWLQRNEIIFNNDSKDFIDFFVSILHRVREFFEFIYFLNSCNKNQNKPNS